MPKIYLIKHSLSCVSIFNSVAAAIGSSSCHVVDPAYSRDEQEGDDPAASAEIYEASSQVTCLVSCLEIKLISGYVPHPRYGRRNV
jgi:hypothetical protein